VNPSPGHRPDQYEQHRPGHRPAAAAPRRAARHRAEPAPRVARVAPVSRRVLAVLVAVTVAVGGVGVAGAAAAPKHLSAPSRLSAPKHLSAPAHLSAPEHLSAPKHLARAPKHLGVPAAVVTGVAASVPGSATGQAAASHSSGHPGWGTAFPGPGAGPDWWPWRGVLHGRLTVRTRTGAATLSVQRGVVTAVDATSVTVLSTDGFSTTWTFDPGVKVRTKGRRGTVSDLRVGARIGLVGSGDETAPTATHVVVPKRPKGPPPAPPTPAPAADPTDPGSPAPDPTDAGTPTPGDIGDAV